MKGDLEGGRQGWIDAHCHLSDARIFDDASALIDQAVAVGVSTMVLAGVEPDEWQRQKILKQKCPENLILNFGLHPWSVEKMSDAEIKLALVILKVELPFAQGLGETGLDFGKKRDPASFEKQKDAFREQIRIAVNASKPMVLHVVQAHEDALSILQEELTRYVPLLVHSFSGSAGQLELWLKMGAWISFSGSIVRANGYEKVKKALARVPLDRLLFETDSPDQYWEKVGMNVPANVVQVYEAAAGILGVPLEKLQEIMADNLGEIYYPQ